MLKRFSLDLLIKNIGDERLPKKKKLMCLFKLFIMKKTAAIDGFLRFWVVFNREFSSNGVVLFDGMLVNILTIE